MYWTSNKAKLTRFMATLYGKERNKVKGKSIKLWYIY